MKQVKKIISFSEILRIKSSSILSQSIETAKAISFVIQKNLSILKAHLAIIHTIERGQKNIGCTFIAIMIPSNMSTKVCWGRGGLYLSTKACPDRGGFYLNMKVCPDWGGFYLNTKVCPDWGGFYLNTKACPGRDGMYLRSRRCIVEILFCRIEWKFESDIIFI